MGSKTAITMADVTPAFCALYWAWTIYKYSMNLIIIQILLKFFASLWFMIYFVKSILHSIIVFRKFLKLQLNIWWLNLYNMKINKYSSIFEVFIQLETINISMSMYCYKAWEGLIVIWLNVIRKITIVKRLDENQKYSVNCKCIV